MAYIVYDPDASSFCEPSYVSALDRPPHFFMAPGVNEGVNAQRNLLDAFEDSSGNSTALMLPVPSNKDTVRVYLRVKPKTIEESQLSADSQNNPEESGNDDSLVENCDNLVKIESEHQIAFNAPKESVTYKNSMNGAGKLLHRYSFTKIFPEDTDQKSLFFEMVLPRMKDFMEGQNQLIFTYGASSSGKTYTIQGTNEDPGILPRALDVIFNSIGRQQTLTLDLKPNCFNGVVQMKEKDVASLEHDKQEVLQLALELQDHNKRKNNGHEATKMSGLSEMSADSLLCTDVTNMSQECVTSLFPELSGRTREEAEVPLKHDDINYAVWISFAEIYNENIHDLLQKMPEPKRKGDKPRRNPLKLAEDQNGSIYIKGLKEIKVNSADEAYQVMMIGRENLHFAATRLNHHSSRSHCIFTIKVIRVAQTAKPHLARVSMLSFCDLAGSERIKKTMNTGERQKEAGNINTSLMVLGRCMKSIRHNQMFKDPKKHQIVPYRDSKLTRLFQSFLCGHGKASMVVNISQAPYLFDESIQVLKFAAIASKVTVEVVKTPETVKPNRKRQTRFSMIIDASKKTLVNNPLFGRESIEWEVPKARSTMCPPVDETINETSELSILDDTVVDLKYDKLMKLVDDLRDQLVKEKKEKVTLEKEVRTELCDEFNEMMVEIEKMWEKRLQDEKGRSEELAEYRLQTMQEAYWDKKSTDKSGNETAFFQQEEMQLNLEEKEAEIKHLQEKISAMNEAHSSMQEECARLQGESKKWSAECQKEKQKSSDLKNELQEKVEALEKAESLTRQVASEKSKSTCALIEDLEEKLEVQHKAMEKMEEEKKNLKDLLDEASEDFLEKDRQLEKVDQKNMELEKEVLQLKMTIKELQANLEESRLLLTDANSRLEEREKDVADLEEKLDEVSAGLLVSKEQDVSHAQEKSNLIEQISELKKANLDVMEIKNERERLRHEVELKDKEIQSNEKELKSLQGEIKSLIQAEKHASEKLNDMASDRDMVRKQLKELSASLSKQDNSERLRKQIAEKDSAIEKLNFQLASLKKEDNALEILNKELDIKTKEKTELASKVELLQSEIASHEYDMQKTRSEKEQAIKMYDQRLRKVTDELAVAKNESVKLSGVLSRSTPVKNSKKESMEAELNMLREELKKKSEVIQQLEGMIPSRKTLSYSSDEESESIKLDNEKLREENEKLKRDMTKAMKAKDKVIQEYRETNMDLQRQIGVPLPPSASSSVHTDASTLEADDSQNDNSMIENTPLNSRKRKQSSAAQKNKRKKAHISGYKTDSANQGSFEDSNIENESATEDQPRRSTRVSRSRPVRRTRSSRSSKSDSSSSVLKEVNESQLEAIVEENNGGKSNNGSSSITPTANKQTGGKKQLLKTGRQVEICTPPQDNEPSTPRTIVRRQLRSRKKNKN